MGSLGGHMNHLWEDLELSFRDLKEIMHKTCSGNLRATEKFDGINIHFRIDASGEARFATSGSDREKGGLTQPSFINKYENHPARESFLEATEAISQVSKNVYWKFGFSGRNWVECDLIKSSRPMTIKYDKNAVVFHGLKNYSTELSPSLVREFKNYAREFSEYTVNVNESQWGFYSQVSVELDNIFGNGVFNNFSDSIDRICECANLNENSTLKDYAKIAIMQGMIQELNISEEKKESLLCHIFQESFNDKPTNLVHIKSGLSKSVAKKVSALGAKVNRHNIFNEALKPIEIVVTLAGSRVLENCKSALVEDAESEIDRISSGLLATRMLIENSDDGYREKRQEMLQKYQEKLDYCSNSVSCIEGIVFEHNDNVYKITGTFAPINHILGIAKFGRGKVPALKEGVKLIDKIDLIKHFSVG